MMTSLQTFLNLLTITLADHGTYNSAYVRTYVRTYEAM